MIHSLLSADKLNNWDLQDIGKSYVVAYKIFGIDLIGRLCNASAYASDRIYKVASKIKEERCEDFEEDITPSCTPAIYSFPDKKTAFRYVPLYKKSSKQRHYIEGHSFRLGDSRAIDYDVEKFDWDKLPYNSHWNVLTRQCKFMVAEVLIGGRISKQDARVASEYMKIWKVL